MVKFVKRVAHKVGLPPGTLHQHPDKKNEKIKIELIDYTESRVQEMVVEDIKELLPLISSLKDTTSVTWVNIYGVQRTDIIQEIGKNFGLHPLIMEDIATLNQRPKIEVMENYLFVIVKMIYYRGNEMVTEQVSLIVAPTFVISFQEMPRDVFDSIRERIRSNKGIIRKMGNDYLAYSLIDTIVDNYFVVLERMGEEIGQAEENVTEKPGHETLNSIYELKRKMIFLHRTFWSMRDIINSLYRSESKLIKKSTKIYLRDVYDHIVQIIDTNENFREMLSWMIEIYLSSISNKLNEIMKVLTIIATIFIPLTFVTSIYGMNFKYMPEIGWRWGYYSVWAIITLVAGCMLYYFRTKRWI